MKKNWLVIAILTLATHATFAADSGFMTADDDASPAATPAANSFSCESNQYTEKSAEAASLAQKAFGFGDLFKRKLVEQIKSSMTEQSLATLGGNSGKTPNVVTIVEIKGLLHVQISGITLPAKACRDNGGIQVVIDATKNTFTKSFGRPIVQLTKTGTKTALLKQMNGSLFPAATYEWAMR